MMWLIGSKGMLGQELAVLLEKKNMPFIGTGREVDVTDGKALEDFAKNREAPFRWIINCAAYTAVDKAEDDAETCRRLNSLGAANIAACAKSIGARMIHISTDYVFDGKGITITGTDVLRPYREDDETNPSGVYGLTKRDGELAVMENNPRSSIIRTAWLYGKYGNNFVHTMLRFMQERDEVKVVNDQRGTPTWTKDLASVIITLIEKTKAVPSPSGVYHFTNMGECTWFDFAQAIYAEGRKLGILTKECQILPCTSDQFPAKVKRPLYSVLDKSKISAALNITIPFWKESLRNFLFEVKDAYQKAN
ncbi:NAD(P)-dependent oxidoreductase [Spirochaetia bacterium]|nr:NAD(P)-dependent oxidoreductase [Spirochaetia bacterium]